jgi:hypothetical protein
MSHVKKKTGFKFHETVALCVIFICMWNCGDEEQEFQNIQETKNEGF